MSAAAIRRAPKRVEKGSIPSADYGEPNDRAPGARALPRARMIRATLDWRDDPADVYKLKLRRGEKLTADARGTVRGTVCFAAATQRALLARRRDLRHAQRGARPDAARGRFLAANLFARRCRDVGTSRRRRSARPAPRDPLAPRTCSRTRDVDHPDRVMPVACGTAMLGRSSARCANLAPLEDRTGGRDVAISGGSRRGGEMTALAVFAAGGGVANAAPIPGGHITARVRRHDERNNVHVDRGLRGSDDITDGSGRHHHC